MLDLIVFGLVVAALVVGGELFARRLRRMGRLSEDRYFDATSERAKKLAQVPSWQLICGYVSIGLVGLALMLFLMREDVAPILSNFVVPTTGAAGLAYLVWFSIRWWHLR